MSRPKKTAALGNDDLSQSVYLPPSRGWQQHNTSTNHQPSDAKFLVGSDRLTQWREALGALVAKPDYRWAQTCVLEQSFRAASPQARTGAPAVTTSSTTQTRDQCGRMPTHTKEVRKQRECTHPLPLVTHPPVATSCTNVVLRLLHDNRLKKVDNNPHHQPCTCHHPHSASGTTDR